jgi:hypothetical protein
MPADAGIHDFAARTKESRGYRPPPVWRSGRHSRIAVQGGRYEIIEVLAEAAGELDTKNQPLNRL